MLIYKTMIPPDLSPSSYLVLGLAHCFYKADGAVHGVRIIEPIPSASLETLFKQVPTAYEVACAVQLGEVLNDQGELLVPVLLQAYEAQPCMDFAERAIACARTYATHPQAQLIPYGNLYQEFNFSLEKKRILNAKRIVKDEDNIKQHGHTHKVL